MQKKLRIAIVCDAIDDSTLWGSFISWKRFGAWLAKAGHEIIRITSRFHDETKRKDFSYAKIYEFPTLPAIGEYKIRFAYTSASRLSKIFQQENIDVIYSIHPTLIARQAVRAAKKLHIPVVSHVHSLPELFLPRAPRSIQKFIKTIIASFYKKYNGLIFPTQFLQNTFADCHFTSPQTVIGNGVDTGIYCSGGKKVSEEFTVLYVGRLNPEKNIASLIQAFHILDTQKKLWTNIYGKIVGWWSMKKKLHQLVSEYNVSKNISFTGRMVSSSSDLITTYQQAWVFVLPSLYETEWMVVLEAMACGCPLLIADSPTSAAKEFVHNNGYTFDPRNAQDLADKIYQLSNNPELCKLMGKISAEAAENFSFTLSVQKLEYFFHSLINYE